MRTLNYSVGADGIAIITLDAQDRPMNVVSPQFIDDVSAVVENVANDPRVQGAIITSAKPAFMAGADLKYILSLMEDGITERDALDFGRKPQAMHRRIETCGKPFVAALNGLALGGGYELALACHWRVIVDDPQAVTGLPEVTVGLLPGSGGTQRLPRMIGLENALTILLDGKTPAPAQALELGMVDAVVPADRLMDTARQWILGSPNTVRAWDHKNYKTSGGLLNPAVANIMATRTAAIAAQTQHNYPAPVAILSAVFEGMILPFDKALKVESKFFAKLLANPIARNIVRSTFVNKREAAKLSRRPKNVPQKHYTKVGVLGAGMMGAGIAHVSALVGLDVVLLDSKRELADQGKAYSNKVFDKAIARGRQTPEMAKSILARIKPTAEYGDLKGCDIIVEAVFENIDVKADVTRKAEAVIPVAAIFASNTSTLPISQLAQASARGERFIGLHFFSPVDRMPLVEVIVGHQTSEQTLAQALDFVGRLRMVPIVVNDSRGFFTSRVFQTFIHESMKMLEDGIEPALIENAARQAGFPVGPLALIDETTLELTWKIVNEAAAAEGDRYVRPCSYEVMRKMMQDFDRPGRKYGQGFYDYHEGKRGTFWTGLKAAFPLASRQPQVGEVKNRLLYIQALEAARCLEEGVLRHPADGDLGSLLGWGFPSWTGGALSFIETVGLARFVEDCDRMAKEYGPRFLTSLWLQQKAQRGHTFYGSAVA